MTEVAVSNTELDSTAPERKRVVIIGAGFGGLAATKALADAPVDVTTIDRNNHHLFQPLLYQVATAGLNPSDIAQPIRRILAKQANCRPVLGDVTDIHTDKNQVETSVGTFDYDYLILATGATHAYFGNDQWAEHAPGLKTIDDALEIRRRILLAFEQAELTDDPEERDRLMTFVVVGAGPTGVEMAGAIREIATRTLKKDFKKIDTTTQSQVLLVEAGPAVLPPFPEKLQRSATEQLAELGVDIRTDARVTDIDERGVTTTMGFIPAGTVIWAAGVAASPLGDCLGGQCDRSGRAHVNTDLSLEGYPNVFAIGDVAQVTDGEDKLVPGVAPAAEQGGIHAAACIAADHQGAERPVFIYNDKGSMATIGRSKAVANLSERIQFGGRAAWALWGLVHVASLIGFRSRIRTMGSWTWQYLTDQRSARLITGRRSSS